MTLINSLKETLSKMMMRTKEGALAYLIRQHGIIKLTDLALYSILVAVREYLYKPSLHGYGLVEALFFPREIDYWTRYIDVSKAVLKHFKERLAILDVGAGMRGGISFFLRQSSHTLILLDRNRFDRKPWFRQVVIGDGTKLPFRDDCFDIVVSVATLEHIPKDARRPFLMELKRISKMVILHFPCEDESGKFMGRRYDLLFQHYHQQIFGAEEEKTAEHIASIHPSINELKALFPRSKVIGRKNCSVWLKYMVLSRRPIIGFLTGLIYLLFWKKEDNKPPYYECMFIYKKIESKRL